MVASSSAGPPTVQLPPIRKIQQSSAEDLRAALEFLGSLYSPEVRPDRRSYRRLSARISGQSSSACHATTTRRRGTSDPAQAGPGALDVLRADGYERSYAIRWLTALVSRAGQLDIDDVAAESLIQDAAGLLAICAGTSSAGTRSRVFVFGAGEDSPAENLRDVRVQLTDLPLDNQDYTSVGAQTWGGACLMADLLVQSPSAFGVRPAAGRPLRILELGAGTGLVGLALGRALERQGTRAELVATDYHPTVLANLRANVALNFPAGGAAPVAVSVHALDWAAFAAPDAPAGVPPFDVPFDVVLGADIIYELEHARWIKCVVAALLRAPPPEAVVALAAPPAPAPQFHLVLPLRATHAAESASVEQVFPCAADVRAGTESPAEGEPARRELGIVAKEVVVCEDWARGGGADVEYVHYTISWI
ncbi:hypothetical protein PsYK624_058020 [Phanerochaete sordida]|uniref:S-adenosyl-L-methionine-dependent methyltransferase n=1 Tax=Phanerochaete sordida TaxID=48140 RepID=A0A9P3LBP7_9APHY|nr:hypothetical protein PsYK624_058020 [Phanerochaete sordida]